MVDLTPWDKSGYSWMGLKRDQAKSVATVFLVSGIALADPPFSILPTDFINVWIAGILKNTFGIDMTLSLVLTYTVLAWGLIMFGAWIYPYNSRKVLSGYINKFKRLMKKATKDPAILIVGVIIFYYMFKWYQGVL